jgi:hypothetical protein
MVGGSGTSRREQASSDIQTWPRRATRKEPLRSWTGYGEAVHLTQGSPTDLVPSTAIGAIKPSRRGDPKAAREKRVADSQGVLMTQSLRSTGNRVEEKTLAIGKHGGTGERGRNRRTHHL